MSEQLTITITAKDGASQVFRAVGSSASQMGQQIDKASASGADGFDSLISQVQSLESEITSAGQAMTGIGAVITGALAVPMLAGAKAAFQQVSAVEQATFALKAYGGSAEEVNDVLKDLTAFAQDASRSGGIFWSEDLFKAAQNLVVMGDELENVSDHVQIMARAVGLGTVSWDELGMVIGRVLSTGRLAGNEFDELSKAGFQLDTSLRNTSISAEELFAALDQGIPEDSLVGQADTIQGKLVYLQGALINVGQALLGVNEDLQFVEGGLGDQLVDGIDRAREAILALQPVAEGIGAWLATAAQGAGAAVDIFLALPQPIQTAVAALTGMAGVTLTAGGAFLLLLPRITATIQAVRALGGAMALLNFTGVGLALTGVAIAGGILLNSWMDQKQAAAEYEATLTTLDQTLESIRRQGDAVLAARGRGVEQLLLDAQEYSNTLRDAESFFDEDLPQPRDPDFGTFVAEYEAATAAAGDLRVDAELTAQAIDALNAILRDPTVDHEAFLRAAEAKLKDAEATKTLTDDIEAFNWIIEAQNEMPTEFLTAYAEEAEGAKAAMDALLGSVAQMPEMWSESIAAQKEVEERQQKLREEWIQSALAIGGFDDALSMLNLSGAASDVTMFAESWQTANEALDNTFRVIVGNTNAIISQVDGIQSWADSLINVRGELGEIDQLLEGGFIDDAQYAAAQTAYDNISVSVGNIRNNLLAVQAIQAPFIAEAIAQTERWAAELRAMPEDVQRTTLALMDQQTVQQTLDLVNLASAASFDLLGESGRGAWEAMFMGAAQANPMLLETAEAFGFIEQSASGIEFNWDAILSGGDAISQLTTQVGYLVDTLRQIHNLPPIEVETNVAGIEQVQAEVEGVLNTVQEADGSTAYMVMTVNAETGELETAGEIIDSVLSADGQTANVTIETTGGEVIEGVIDMATGDITMNVNINPTIAGVSLETGGGLSSLVSGMLGGDGGAVEMPVTITPDTSAVDTALVGYEGQTITVDVVIGTNELDTGLTGWGLGGGDGSGGAAGFDRKSVSVDLRVQNNELDDIGEGTYGPVMVDVEANTTAFAASLATISLGGAGMPAITIPVTADDSDFWQEIAGIDGIMSQRPETVVTVSAETGTAVSDLNNVTSAADAIPESESVTVVALAEGATSALNGVTDAANAIPESESVSVSVSGAGAAVSALQDVANAANNIPSSVSTTITTNRVTNNVQTYSTIGVGPTARHGGIPEFATGGITARMGEAGPELLHFAGGGTAWAPQDALYTVPPMTYVSPANVGHSGGGGDTYNITVRVDGNVVGNDDFADEIAERTAWRIASIKQRRDLAKGVA